MALRTMAPSSMVLGGVGGDQTVFLHHGVDHVGQAGPGLVFAGVPVVDEKYAFHSSLHYFTVLASTGNDVLSYESVTIIV